MDVGQTVLWLPVWKRGRHLEHGASNTLLNGEKVRPQPGRPGWLEIELPRTRSSLVETNASLHQSSSLFLRQVNRLPVRPACSQYSALKFWCYQSEFMFFTSRGQIHPDCYNIVYTIYNIVNGSVNGSGNVLITFAVTSHYSCITERF